MISLITYVNENSGVKVTLGWMKEKYAEFNETLFDNKLPECRLEVTKLKNKMLGLFSFDDKIFCLNPRNIGGNKKYRMYKSENDKPKSINDISEVHPTISMNNEGFFRDELAMESTLIHEMIHFYTYKDCWAPAIAHGKEFKQWCTIIGSKGKKKYSKDFDLTVYADYGKYEADDATKKREEAKLLKHGLGMVIVEVEKDRYPERVMFTTNTYTQLIINEARKEHVKHRNLKKILVVRDILDLMPHEYFQNFVKTRAYGRFYLPENVTEIWDKIILSPNLEIVYDKEKGITEGKIKEILRKVKEKIVNLLVKPKTNLSVEDIEKIGIIEPIDMNNEL